MAERAANLDVRLNILGDAKRALDSSVASARDVESVMLSAQKSAAEARAEMKQLVGSTAEVKAARASLKSQLKAEEDQIGLLRLKWKGLKDSEQAAAEAAAKVPKKPVGILARFTESFKRGKNTAQDAAAGSSKDASTAAAATSSKSSEVAAKKADESAKRAEAAAQRAGAGGASGGAPRLGLVERAGNAAGVLTQRTRDAASALASGAKESALSGAADAAGTAVAGLEGALVAAAVALPALAAGAAVAITKFGDAERSAALAREAWFGEKNGKAAGTWVDALGSRLSLARGEVQKTAISLRQAGLGGAAFTSALEASTTAAAALGEGPLASKVQELSTRFGRRQNRFSLGKMELDGTGLDFDDVATALAKSTKKGVGEARKELMAGRLTVAQGAGALRDAIQAKFGNVIDKKQYSLDAIGVRAKNNFGQIFAAAKVDQILKPLSHMVDMLDPKKGIGKGLADGVEAASIILGKMAEFLLPKVEEFMLGLGLISLDIADTALDWYLNFKNGTSWVQKATAGVKELGGELKSAAEAAASFLGGGDDLGHHLGSGMASGIRGSVGRVAEAAAELVTGADKSVRTAADMHSPSKVFRAHGLNMGTSLGLGLDDSAGDVEESASALTWLPDAPSGGRGGAGAGDGGGGEIVVRHVVDVNGPDADLNALFKALFEKAMKGPSFGAALNSNLNNLARQTP